MKIEVLLLFALVAPVAAFGQATPPIEYQIFVNQADSLHRIGMFKESALAYTSAFQSFGWKGYLDHRYGAAQSFAMSGMSDSAFNQLEKIAIKIGFADYGLIANDPELKSLHTHLRWQPLLKIVAANKAKIEVTLNKPLVDLLDSMAIEDQKWRNYFTRFRNKQMGSDTTSYSYISRKMHQTDSLNYFQLQKIYVRYGFPNHDTVGQEGTNNFWLLVQHQDSNPKFQDSVLVKMKMAVDAKKASSVNYAYLVDRVRINTGKLQVYGTQMELNAAKTSYEPKPVEAPEKLNERRKAMGMGNIESYIATMNRRYFGQLKGK